MSIKQEFFLPNDLKTLDLALIGAVAIAKELGVRPQGLAGALRRRLFVIAGEGITDPETLSSRLVKSMNLDRIAY
jgi:hypothetical protein